MSDKQFRLKLRELLERVRALIEDCPNGAIHAQLADAMTALELAVDIQRREKE